MKYSFHSALCHFISESFLRLNSVFNQYYPMQAARNIQNTALWSDENLALDKWTKPFPS